MTRKTHDLHVRGPMLPGFDELLCDDALAFVAGLASTFGVQVAERLAGRTSRQAAIDDGAMPDFLAATAAIRSDDWRIAEVPDPVFDQRVSIIAPVTRDAIFDALNSAANAWVADCEDSLSPTWHNVIQGQIHLRDVVAGRIELRAGGQPDEAQHDMPTLIVRPRGWQLVEKHLLQAGMGVPAAFVDVGLFLVHNAAELRNRGSRPVFCLPKIESHLEARLWKEVFLFAEQRGVVEPGEIKVTVIIETLPAAFEIDEILFELRDYVVGLLFEPTDFIFSFIRSFSRYPEFVLPDRAEITTATHFLRSCSRYLAQTCRRRGVQAIAAVVAQQLVQDDDDASDRAFTRLRADMARELADGYDGFAVAHPGLVTLAAEMLDGLASVPNQAAGPDADHDVSTADLLQVHKGKITETGVRDNINVALRYLAAWLGGNGCVALDHRVEDAATLELCRAQLWQWVRQPTGILDEGRNITYELFKRWLREEMQGIRNRVGDAAFDAGRFRQAAALLDRATGDEDFVPFLTVLACEEMD